MVQLLCFPYAGASASVYLRWRRLAPSGLDIVPVEFPGHGQRWSEALTTNMNELISDLVARYQPARPFALFGHSLGALVAFEYARAVERSSSKKPIFLFASGSHAPHAGREESADALSDAALRSDLVEFAGTPAEALANAELMQLVLPVLRADYQLAMSYQASPHAMIPCPIHAIGGRDDKVDQSALQAWQRHTRQPLKVTQLPGGHFYLRQRERDLLTTIESSLHSPAALLWGSLPTGALPTQSREGDL